MLKAWHLLFQSSWCRFAVVLLVVNSWGAGPDHVYLVKEHSESEHSKQDWKYAAHNWKNQNQFAIIKDADMMFIVCEASDNYNHKIREVGEAH